MVGTGTGRTATPTEAPKHRSLRSGHVVRRRDIRRSNHNVRNRRSMPRRTRDQIGWLLLLYYTQGSMLCQNKDDSNHPMRTTKRRHNQEAPTTPGRPRQQTHPSFISARVATSTASIAARTDGHRRNNQPHASAVRIHIMLPSVGTRCLRAYPLHRTAAHDERIRCNTLWPDCREEVQNHIHGNRSVQCVQNGTETLNQ